MKEEKHVIGKALRNTRLSRKISIEKASKETKISQTYLRAIEEQDFDKIPGDVVLKGFIRVYSDFLGLDPAPLIAELSAKKKKESTRPEPAAPVKKKEPVFDGGKSMKAVLVSIVLIALIAGIFSFSGFLISSLRNASAPAADQVKVSSQDKSAFEIRAEVIERTWMLVEADGKSVFKGMAFPGDERTWTAEKMLAVKVGNAAGLKLTSGGEVLLAPGKRGEVIYKEFKR
jgi:cytoskeletal protein RodZ